MLGSTSSLRRPVARELVGDHHALDVRQALEQFSQEAPGRVPLVPGARTSSSQRVCVDLAEFLPPLPDRLVGDDHPPLGEELLHVAVAEGEPEIAPDGVRDDRWREPMALIGEGGSSFIHAPSIARLGG